MNTRLKPTSFVDHFSSYIEKLQGVLRSIPKEKVFLLQQLFEKAQKEKKQIFIFGNGGSAGNAIHIANDFIYGASKDIGKGFKINALPSNTSVLTCLANDEGYEEVFVRQLAVLANPGDIVVALSGSGNSANIVKALKWSKENGNPSVAILGFSGGHSLNFADVVIHTPIDDMQISEDIQLVIFHALMQYFCKESNA